MFCANEFNSSKGDVRLFDENIVLKMITEL
jgi:hypothetical protein